LGFVNQLKTVFEAPSLIIGGISNIPAFPQSSQLVGPY